MKVLHVIPSVSKRSGGPGQAIVPMCKALQRKGIEVTIVSTNHDLESKLDSLEGIPAHIFDVQFGDSFKYSKKLSSWLDLNVEGFDVVHIHAVFNHSSIAAGSACRKRGVPYIIRPLGSLDPWSMRQKPFRKQIFLTLGGRRLLSKAAAIQYTTEGEKNATQDSLKLNHGAVVPLGIDNEFGKQPGNAESFAQLFPALNGFPYILVLSRLHTKKNIETLLHSFLKISKEKGFSHWRLALAGDGPAEYVAALKQLALNANANDRVLFTGWLDSTAKTAILRSASLLALTSFQENFGLCALEAMACGVPVLVSANVNLAEEIERSGAGWITEPNEEAISQRLAEVLGNAHELERRGQAGEELARSYSWDSVGDALSALYFSVVNDKHR